VENPEQRIFDAKGSDPAGNAAIGRSTTECGDAEVAIVAKSLPNKLFE
jgi:hypothetical protein